MRGQMEITALANAALSVMMFSLLVVGMSMKFGDINVLLTWADASSFANAMASRAYSSADCFAYENVKILERNGELVQIKRVYPGVIDVRKFTQDRYFDCVQNYYSSWGSEIDYLTANVPSYSEYVITFKLKDLDDPDMIRRLGDTLSTEPQVDIGESKEYLDLMTKWLKDLAFWLDVTSFALDVAINAIVIPTRGWPVQVSPVLKVGDVISSSVIEEDLHEFYKERASKYTSSVPVIIRYVDDEGNVIEDHRGVLETTIYYTST